MNDDRARALQSHISAHAKEYYSEIGQELVHLQWVQTNVHRASTIYRFNLSTAIFCRQVLVKTPPLVLHKSLAEQTDPATKFRQEYEALAHIYDYFQRLGDADFAAIRPLDFVPEWHAIVMEDARYPRLRDLFSKTSRLQIWSNAADLQVCFRNAGKWLRLFHALSRPQASPRDTTRADFVALIEKYTAHLRLATGEEAFFRRLVLQTTAKARDLFPEVFPLGLTHGDYALRNLLIGPQNCVLALDTQAKWFMPIYEDLAYFLVGLVTTWPQVLSQGLAFDRQDLERFEQEFLQGYFAGDSVPAETVRLFKIKIMLLKWSTNVHRMQRLRSGLTAVRRKLMHRFYYRSLVQLMLRPEGSS